MYNSLLKEFLDYVKIDLVILVGFNSKGLLVHFIFIVFS